MNKNTGRPDHIEDYLVKLHPGSWFGWSNSKNKIYANLILHPKLWDNSYTGTIHEEGLMDNPHSKPTEQACIDGLAQMQSDFDTAKTNKENKLASGKAKLKELGLDDDELKQILGI